MPMIETYYRPPTEAPTVSAPGEQTFIVAVRRAHGPKIYVFPAHFLNEMELEWGDEGMVARSGWHMKKHHRDYDDYFEPLLEDGDQLLGWMPLPPFDAESPARNPSDG